MKAFDQHEATNEVVPIEFSMLHRIMLLAMPCLFLVLVAFQLAGKPWVHLDYLFLALALVVGLMTSVGVVHAVLILVDAPGRRIVRNIVPTLVAIASFFLFGMFVLVNFGRT